MAKFSLRALLISFLMSRFRAPRDLVRFAFGRYRNRLAIVDERGQLTYQELENRTLRLVEGWRCLGIGKGDLIFTILPEAREQLETRLAAYESGAIMSAFHQRLPQAMALHFIRQLEPKLVLYDPVLAGEIIADLAREFPHMRFLARGQEYENFIAQYAPRRSAQKLTADDMASLHLTSGTTGQPKAIAVAGGTYLNSLRMVLKGLDLNVKRTLPDVNALGVPLTGPGVGLLLPTLLAGSALVIPPTHTPETLLPLIEKHRITLLFIAPTVLIDLLDYPELNRFDLSSLHTIIYGSELMPAAKMVEAIQRFGPIFQQSYGSFEAVPPLTALRADQHMLDGKPASAEVLSSAGYVVDQVSIRIVNEQERDLPPGEIGKIMVQSPNVFKGYWRQPELSDAVLKNGWLITGDLGYFDAGRRLHVLGRSADLVHRRGDTIYPRQVEEVMHEHPAVKLVVLVQRGQDAVLVVSLRQAYRGETNGEAMRSSIMKFAREHLDIKQVPDEIVIMDELPRSFLSKILRREVRLALHK